MNPVSNGNGSGAGPVDQLDHHKHMDYVQGVITRLATNSFLLKGWALTVTVALLGFGASRNQMALAALGVIPVCAFWFLDAYYLRQERAFRDLYRAVADQSVSGFSLDQSSYLVGNGRWGTAKSPSLSAFYGPMAGVCLIVAAVLTMTNSTTPHETGSTAPRETPALDSGPGITEVQELPSPDQPSCPNG